MKNFEPGQLVRIAPLLDEGSWAAFHIYPRFVEGENGPSLVGGGAVCVDTGQRATGFVTSVQECLPGKLVGMLMFRVAHAPVHGYFWAGNGDEATTLL